MNKKNDFSRRNFLKVCGGAAAGLTVGSTAGLSGCGSNAATAVTPTTGQLNKEDNKTLLEHGFWDYTCPVTGGMEAFQRDDYTLLLDDMAGAGMNSLVICPKWMTTGYRSRLHFIDQSPDNPVTASDNALLRYAIDEAKKRKIKVWLLAVVNFFEADKFGDFTPHVILKSMQDFKFPFPIGVYDSDTPVLAERAAQVCEELVELFTGIDGLIIELENDNIESPHRIPLYNAWAKENNREPFEKIGHPINPRARSVSDWRDYTTYRRLEIIKVVEKAVRAKGFHGDLAAICGQWADKYDVSTEINFEIFHSQLPHFSAVTYSYSNLINRYATKDFGIALPKSLGIKTYHLPRGVMTYAMPRLGNIKLEQNWLMDVEDFKLFKPDGIWWFGCGSLKDGIHVSLSTLRDIGFRDGVQARRALLKKVSIL